MFIPYPKIHRLGAEENDGILLGTCYIQEKIDGANTSIWLEGDEIKTASRTQIKDSGFNGFVDYARAHEGIKKLLADNPTYRIYGEWLVRHTVAYNEASYRKWYLYDVLLSSEQKLNDQGEVVGTNCKFMPLDQVYELAQKYGIETPMLFEKLENPTAEYLQKYVGKSALGEKGEGVVIKNFEFFNKFSSQVYAKVVTQEFKEDNATMFGGNNKHSDTYWETYLVNKYMTMERVQKIMHKLQPLVDKRLDMEHTPRIINTAYHDMLTEEIWEIQKTVTGDLNFKNLARLAQRKAAVIFHAILGNIPSVAFKPEL